MACYAAMSYDETGMSNSGRLMFRLMKHAMSFLEYDCSTVQRWTSFEEAGGSCMHWCLCDHLGLQTMKLFFPSDFCSVVFALTEKTCTFYFVTSLRGLRSLVTCDGCSSKSLI